MIISYILIKTLIPKAIFILNQSDRCRFKLNNRILDLKLPNYLKVHLNKRTYTYMHKLIYNLK